MTTVSIEEVVKRKPPVDEWDFLLSNSKEAHFVIITFYLFIISIDSSLCEIDFSPTVTENDAHSIVEIFRW